MRGGHAHYEIGGEMKQSAAGIAGVMAEVIATGLLSSLCTITVPPTDEASFDAGGALKPDAVWPVLAGHSNIRCTAPPMQTNDTLWATRIKMVEQDQSKNARHVLLEGYYPALLPTSAGVVPTLRATIDGVVYEVMNGESDSQHQMIRLAIQLVTI